MRVRHHLPGQKLQVAAAAVLLGLGSTAIAQQESEDPSGQQSQQSQSESQIGQERSSEQGQQGQQAQQSQGQQDETQVARAGDTGQGGSADLDQLSEQNGDIEQFIEAIKTAGMDQSLTDGTRYTLFAPTNDALEQMSGMDLEELMQPENRDQLVSMLRAHIVADEVDSQMARSLGQAQTIDGGTIEISESDGELQVGDASVVEPDIQQGSLMVHAIDQVLSEGRTQTAALEGQQESGQSQDQQEQQGQSDFETEAESELESGAAELESEATELGNEAESELESESESDSDSLLR